MSARTRQPLAPEEEQALIAAAAYFGRAAAYFGRTWKMELRDCWMRADYPYGLDGPVAGALQRLRNSHHFGPSGLIAYRLPKLEDK